MGMHPYTLPTVDNILYLTFYLLHNRNSYQIRKMDLKHTLWKGPPTPLEQSSHASYFFCISFIKKHIFWSPFVVYRVQLCKSNLLQAYNHVVLLMGSKDVKPHDFVSKKMTLQISIRNLKP